MFILSTLCAVPYDDKLSEQFEYFLLAYLLYAGYAPTPSISVPNMTRSPYAASNAITLVITMSHTFYELQFCLLTAGNRSDIKCTERRANSYPIMTKLLIILSLEFAAASIKVLPKYFNAPPDP